MWPDSEDSEVTFSCGTNFLSSLLATPVPHFGSVPQLLIFQVTLIYDLVWIHSLAMTLALTPGDYFQRLSCGSPTATLGRKYSVPSQPRTPGPKTQRPRPIIPGSLSPVPQQAPNEVGQRSTVSRSAGSPTFTTGGLTLVF